MRLWRVMYLMCSLGMASCLSVLSVHADDPATSTLDAELRVNGAVERRTRLWALLRTRALFRRFDRKQRHQGTEINERRRWFAQSTPHDTRGTVNVLNLVEGREAVVESPTGAFEPLVVHYAETFIVPASAGAYTIRPSGESEGKKCGTIKAFVRRNDPLKR